MGAITFSDGKGFSGILCVADDQNDYVLRVGERVYYFEWSDRWGPLFVGAKGQSTDNSRIQNSAYRAASIWFKQGKRTEQQGKHLRAIWDNPPAITYQYVRQGRSRLIVNVIEPEGALSDYSEEIFEDVTPASSKVGE